MFQGKKYFPLPYVVKGMDISLSGILSYIEKEAPVLIKKGEYTAEDLCYRFVSLIIHQFLHYIRDVVAPLKRGSRL